MLNLIIYEDKDILRESLSLMLGGMEDVKVIAAFSNCNTVEQDIKSLQPQVVLMDIDMPGKNGIYGVEKIKETNPEINVIMHTVFDDDDKIFKSLEAGADGYLLKNTSPAKLYEAIKDVTLGSAPISPGVAKRVLQAFHNKPKQSFDLSQREQQILQLLVDGYTYKRISAECFIAMDTVRTHLKNIYTKLQVNTGKEAITKALKYRIVKEN
ncbi:response regulator [Limnovirga soli]|uniref:Response regulator n=1 Tax=Limnovirga soli TaxID=2656915 RepID=A0A8J8FGL6_9BACT|nr:response regulator transcription factor [Limnovirga soli]NNV55486.1 response regulator [Limnovirga soli]